MEDSASQQRCIPCEDINSIDANANIENCYYCEKSGCGCENDKAYLEKLVSSITRELLEKIGS